ncbi:DUF2383 domain-containing protein [Mangrovivirga sp. M17]|uniref:DUF2383 domain-containing protein n=1 Tax=Mangrovivirga halotolerans TaxID=2993936 RepID=A0ABT3RQP4_9BACT|nr:DUF2383 domain-containing protein [Mangrovivirga halotolerans]MCX2744109.1 DUF2383 domain-containing protein [Mangrovivirga halotolerans]
METKAYKKELSEVIERNIAVYQGYLRVAREVKDQRLAEAINQHARQRKNFAYTLAAIGHIFDNKTIGKIMEGSTELKSQNGWINLDSITKEEVNDLLILGECIRGERKALDEYDDVKSNVLPCKIEEKIDQQEDTIREFIIALEQIEYELDKKYEFK